MRDLVTSEAKSGIRVLRRFARPPPKAEQCDLCSRELSSGHLHLHEASTRNVVCAFDPCALRWGNVVGGRLKLIPRDTRALRDFRIANSQWESLALPIDLAGKTGVKDLGLLRQPGYRSFYGLDEIELLKEVVT